MSFLLVCRLEAQLQFTHPRFLSVSFRKHELHQVAQQASNIEDLTEVIRASLSVMCKLWSDAMHTFHEKFDSLSSLIIDHGNFQEKHFQLSSDIFFLFFVSSIHWFLPSSYSTGIITPGGVSKPFMWCSDKSTTSSISS